MENEAKRKQQASVRVKIISMGNAEAGKSCIIKRYCERRFVHKYLATIGIDFGVTKVDLDGRELKVNIFDMAGHPLFYEVRNEFYRDTQAAILVYDVTDRASFDALDDWLLELREELGSSLSLDEIIIVVCANKVDRHRQVDEVEGRIWAETRGFGYFETSAQLGQGICEMFEHLFSEVLTVLAARRSPGQALVSNPPPRVPALSYTKEQLEAIRRLKYASNDHDKLGVRAQASREEVNKAYRRLAVLLHPDKSTAPGAEEAFKLLVSVKTSMLRHAR